VTEREFIKKLIIVLHNTQPKRSKIAAIERLMASVHTPRSILEDNALLLKTTGIQFLSGDDVAFIPEYFSEIIRIHGLSIAVV